MRNRILLVSVIAGLFLVGAGGVLLVDPFGWRSNNAASQNAPPPASGQSGAISAPAGQAQEVAAALSKLAEDPAALASGYLKKQVAADPAAAVRPGSKVEANPDSWAPDGIGGGTMIVTVTPPGGPAREYLAVVVKEPDGWKVGLTLPISENR